MNTPQGTIKVKKGIVVNGQEFRQHLGAYIIAMGGKVAKLLQKQARLFCWDMLDYTMPWSGGMGMDGKSNAAKQSGRRRVKSQITAIFLPLRYVSAGEVLQYGNEGIFYAWLNARKTLSNPKLPDWLLVHPYSSEGTTLWQKFQSWEFAQQGAAMSGGLVDLSGYYGNKTEQIHKRARGGDTTAGYFDNMEKTATYGQRYVVDDDGKMVSAYSKRVESHVGRLKAGWYTAGSQLGSMKGVGQWIIGNQWGTGIMNNQLGNSYVPSVTVGNKVQGLHRATKDGFRYALNHRAYSMRVEIYNKLVANNNANLLYHIASHYNVGKGFEIQ
jgi:hypothetical protein